MVTRSGIEAYPKKVRAIISMSSPRNIQEVQRLTGRITTLARFINRSADKSLPFFKVIRRTKNFEWNEESEKAFQELKAYLKQLPVLNKPVQGEEVLLYLAVTPRAAISILVRKEGMNHQPIYFISHVLKGAELNYLTQEKLALDLVITERRLDFRASNNEAEYKALLLGLKAARNLGISRAVLYSDSQLAIQHSNGKFEIKNENMLKYARSLDKAKEGFTELNTELIPRADNTKVDHLACLVRALGDCPDPIIPGRELISQLETLDDIKTEVPEGDWRYDIHKYLTKKELPSDNKRAKEVKRRDMRFVMVDQILFKISFSQPLLKCLGPDKASSVLREIHEGCCESHLGSIALASKALLACFFWHTMRKDSSDLVNSCYNCQRHANL
ncbi:uncharacterized protein [Henckelia pumila]|uniref:uncharacterized protein n=1 Tax=Henckelia pumila TaxID=405737 RepID=UPI003C6E66A4